MSTFAPVVAVSRVARVHAVEIVSAARSGVAKWLVEREGILVVAAGADAEDQAFLGEGITGAGDGLVELGVVHQGDEAGIVAEVAELGVDVPVVDVDGNGGQFEGREHHLEVFAPVGELHADEVARSDAGLIEATSKSVRPLIERGVREPACPVEHCKLIGNGVDHRFEQVGQVEFHISPVPRATVVVALSRPQPIDVAGRRAAVNRTLEVYRTADPYSGATQEKWISGSHSPFNGRDLTSQKSQHDPRLAPHRHNWVSSRIAERTEPFRGTNVTT